MTDHQLLLPPDPYPAAEYLPLASLILPVVGSAVQGSVADWQRLLLLGFTLHHLIQLMRFPSGLIRASHAPSSPSHSTIHSAARAARLELRIINVFAISFLVASPFIALGILRALQSVMNPEEPLLDQFATRLCFIAVALRPCAYFMKLFRTRRPSVSNRSSTAVEDLELRSKNLTKALIERADANATSSDLNQLQYEVKAPIRDLRRALKQLVSRRRAAAPATLEAQRILTQTTLKLTMRTESLVDAINQHVAAVARRQSSPSAILLARTNKLINATGTTLQLIGTTLAPPLNDPEYQ